MEIHDLTTKQVEMLDKLWTFDSYDDIKNFKTKLSVPEQKEVETLIEMVRLQAIDDIISAQDESDYVEADLLLDPITRRNNARQ